MLKYENIICISSIDWDFIWQQHQSIMSRLAKNGNKVLFIENTGVRTPTIKDIGRIRRRIINWFSSSKGFRKEAENLYVYSPLILPFPYLRIARLVNRFLLLSPIKRWMKAVDFHDPIIWTFLPTPITLDFTENIFHKALVYYCTDKFSATSRSAKKITRYEEEVMRKADAVFVMARGMVDYCAKFNKDVMCIPMGIDVGRFTDDKNVAEPLEIKGVSRPVIGFIGGVRNSIDKELVVYLAKRFSGYTFVFVGPIQTDISRLKRIGNVIFTGSKDHEELKRYIKFFDVCMIPYKIDDYTNNISPAKLNEYLIMGKPVVSTRLGEVERFNRENGNILFVGGNIEEFGDLIIQAVEKDSDILRKKRKEVACNNSWDKKTEKMSDIIMTVIKRKEEAMELNWKTGLMRLYREARGKTAKAVVAIAALWLIIFYSPLLWFIAEPLRISQVPQKTDAIVVFGGGVGETGSPGKSTIERARYAVSLYKKGYADTIIFSSGYTYIYNDAENMRLFAVSMGVPKRDIILEQNADSAYENVRFSKDIIKRNDWDSILLVSSPYNMRRASLVFNKWDPDIKVTYTPVPDSQFYDKSKGVRLEQIRAIAHEYLGIIYYLIKGHI